MKCLIDPSVEGKMASPIPLDEGMWGLLNATQSDGASRDHDFVPAEANPRIRAALADAGLGTSYQAWLWWRCWMNF